MVVFHDFRRGSSACSQEPNLIYTDASGKGGLGAVCCSSQATQWVAGQAPKGFCRLLKRRRTQICILETVMVICATRIFASQLSHKSVVFFIDNSSALGALRKGSSSCWDSTKSLKEAHLQAFATVVGVMVWRMPDS